MKTNRPTTAGERLSTRKRLLFYALMLLLPVLFFGAVEGGLRLAGYGSAYPLFVPVEGFPQYRYQSRDVARRYFVRVQNVPTSLTDFFRADKPADAFRIVVQGGSSAAGFPFYYGGSFSRMLEQRLQQTFPDRPIEVINTAMAAVNSYTLLDLVDEIIEQAPDAVLVYAGHNEYYGALGVGSAEAVSGFPFVTRAYVSLIRLRTVQALRGLFLHVAGWFGKSDLPGNTLMQRVVGEQSIPYGSPLYEMGLRQFRSNLSRLLAQYEARGIPVFIGTVASNERDHAPFVTVHAAGVDAAAWQAHVDRARSAVARGDTAEALAALDAAIALDSLAAEAYYRKGRLLDGLRRYDEARVAYRAAKDRDALRFRAPEAVNQIIREEAARHGAVVVETQEALARVSPGGIVGGNVMTEHLHPNLDGYFVVADGFYEALRAAGQIGDWVNPVGKETARSEVLITPVDSLVGMYRVRQLMASWPFQPPGVVARDTLRAANPVEEIALELYRDKTTWRDAIGRLQLYYAQQGDYHRALQAALAQIQEYPFLPSHYLAAGNLLIAQARYTEALPYFEASNDLEETSMARRMIGTILLQQNRPGDAIAHLERAVALDAQDVQALYNLAGAYALTRQYERAREAADRLLRLRPDHADGQRLRASLPASSGSAN